MNKGLVTAAAAVFLGLAGPAPAQWNQPQIVKNVAPAKPVPGAHELPNPATMYKVVFDVTESAKRVKDVNPGLATVAEFVNTLAKYNVPEKRRRIAVVLHGDAAEVIVDNKAFMSRNGRHKNPNVELIRKLAKAGVEMHVCGQAVLARHIDPDTILPQIQLDLWALTTLANFETHGYVHIKA